MQEIIIIVKADGSASVEVVGISGPKCLEETRAIEEAMGNVESRELKGTYHEPAAVERRVRIRNGSASR